MFDFLTSVSEIFGFPVRGKRYSGLLFEYIYYIVEYLFVWYSNYSVLWVRLNVINMLDTKKYIFHVILKFFFTRESIDGTEKT